MEPARMIDSRLPPQDLDLERAVLGGCMVDATALREVADFLRPETFYLDNHALVWEAILSLFHDGREADILSVTQKLKERGRLSDTLSPYYVSSLTNKIASTANVQFHARIIAQKHISRKLIEVSHGTIKAGYDDDDCFDMIDGLKKGIIECERYLAVRDMGTAADEAENCASGVRPKFLKFNTPGLREKVMFQPGLVHSFGGRTGLGKSILSTEEAWGWTEQGKVLMFSPEMTRKQITSRILSRESRVPYTNILRADMSGEEQDNVAATDVAIRPRMKRLLIDDTSGVTPTQIRAQVERAKSDHNIIAVIIDHLHEMNSGIGRIDTDTSSRSKVAYCITQVNQIAKDTGLPFMVMCQLNREVEGRPDKKPKISDLLWAGEIEQKSAVIGLLYREGYYQAQPPWEDVLEINVAKNRDGGVGECRARITPALSRIEP